LHGQLHVKSAQDLLPSAKVVQTAGCYQDVAFQEEDMAYCKDQ